MSVKFGSLVLKVSNISRAAEFWSKALGYIPNTSTVDAEVARLISLGATHVEWEYPDHADFVVLADTEGNLFCVIG